MCLSRGSASRAHQPPYDFQQQMHTKLNNNKKPTSDRPSSKYDFQQQMHTQNKIIKNPPEIDLPQNTFNMYLKISQRILPKP